MPPRLLIVLTAILTALCVTPESIAFAAVSDHPHPGHPPRASAAGRHRGRAGHQRKARGHMRWAASAKPKVRLAHAVGKTLVAATTMAAVGASAEALPLPVPGQLAGIVPAPAPAPAKSSSTTSAPRLFSSTSFWNAPLPNNAALDQLSAGYVGHLQDMLTRYVPWINTTSYSTPVYTVPADQPTVRVQLDGPVNLPLQAAFEHVPIPANARPAAGSDQHMTVWQPSTDTLWEFWRASSQSDGWHARYGGKMTGVSTNPGYFTNPRSWGATATSLPLLGGLIRLDELAAGHIDHALALGIPEVRSGVYSWPAQRTDGTINDPTAIPEGTRFRLDPSLDLSKIPMAPLTREIALAVQRYGAVVRDIAGSVAFYAEDPTPTGTNPFGGPAGYFGGQYPSQLLAQFPWSHLQALGTNLTAAR